MDQQRARELIRTERARLEQLLQESDRAAGSDRATADEEHEYGDRAEPMTDQETDDTVSATLSSRLAALDRADERLDNGTYGLSVRSGKPIPDERLEADPAAELTVEEAAEG